FYSANKNAAPEGAAFVETLRSDQRAVATAISLCERNGSAKSLVCEPSGVVAVGAAVAAGALVSLVAGTVVVAEADVAAAVGAGVAGVAVTAVGFCGAAVPGSSSAIGAMVTICLAGFVD